MGKNPLQEFTNYAEFIEAMKPLSFLNRALGELESEMDTLSEEEKEQVQRFCQVLKDTFSDYDQKGVTKPVLACALYNMILQLFKEVMLERKAMELGIQKSFYKEEMTFLFKGKRRKQ